MVEKKEKTTVTASLSTKKMPGDPDYDKAAAEEAERKRKGSIRGTYFIIINIRKNKRKEEVGLKS